MSHAVQLIHELVHSPGAIEAQIRRLASDAPFDAANSMIIHHSFTSPQSQLCDMFKRLAILKLNYTTY